MVLEGVGYMICATLGFRKVNMATVCDGGGSGGYWDPLGAR